MTQTHEIHPTHFVHFNGAGHFVKEADFFISQGGLQEPWGRNWRGVNAESIEAARELSRTMDWLIDHEKKVLRSFDNPCHVDVADLLPGAAFNASCEFLMGSGYLTRDGKLTERGRRALEAI